MGIFHYEIRHQILVFTPLQGFVDQEGLTTVSVSNEQSAFFRKKPFDFVRDKTSIQISGKL